MAYRDFITEYLAEIAPKGGHDPRHIEAWVRSNQNGTLDHLSGTEWEIEIRSAIELIGISGKAQSEKLALSYGLVP